MADLAAVATACQKAVGGNTLHNKTRVWNRYTKYCNSIRLGNNHLLEAWLGIPIFGSNFRDPHQKRNTNSIFDSEDSGRNFFLEFRC